LAEYEARMGDGRSCRILMKLEFSRQIFENTRIIFLMKICPVGAELSHADWRRGGWTDRKLIVAFRNFADAHKNVMCWGVDWIPRELLMNERPS